MEKLLSRTQFREGVFLRDDYKCAMCKTPAIIKDGVVKNLDAHHIMERRLFDDGGYYISNGASLCEKHHIEAEQTILSCEEVREACGIKTVILPPQLYNDNDYTYDKWGNIILPNGTRIKGELFHDESVQKILEKGNVLDLFSKYVKYPRTMHLPWSEKMSKDDRILTSIDHFIGKEVVCTLKLDGENTNLYKDYIHARSLNSGSHPSRNWVKGFWSQIAHDIPEGWRICGENMFAVHTITYDNLESYFYMFSMWNEKNICLSWDETLEYAELIGIKTVPVFYKGVWNEDVIKKSYKEYSDGNTKEGYVIRLADEYGFGDFRKSVAKFVSGDFQIKHGHWAQQKITPNKLKV